MEKPNRDRHSKSLVIGLSLTLLILAVYWQCQYHQFVLWDDYDYIVQNPHVRTGLSVENMKWAFSAKTGSYWHPLTWLSHMLDCQLYGLNPRGHHFNNLLLHIANTLLLFLVLKGMTGALWRSALVAALFALHPLRVESVVWASERKDVLAAFFWMLVMASYHRYVQRPAIGPYLLSLALFALGLLAKPTLVTLPFALLLFDFWPLGRLSGWESERDRHQAFSEASHPRRGKSSIVGLVSEKVPFFCLAALSSAVTFIAARNIGGVPSMDALSLKIRLFNASVSYARYMGKMVWPRDLAFFYPHPMGDLPLWEVTGSVLLLLSISVLAVVWARRFSYLPVGWFWYLGCLIPVIGLVQIGVQAMADRFTYIPMIGLFMIIAWGIPDLVSRFPWRRAFLVLSSGVVLSGLMTATWIEVRYWRDSLTLFQRALRVTENNFMVHSLMGSALEREGKSVEAVSHYYKALDIRADFAPAHKSLGRVLSERGELEKAIHHYSMALEIDPRDWKVYYNLGNAFAMKGDLERALLNYTMALKINPDDANTHNNLGSTLVREGRIEEAVRSFAAALRLDPNHGMAKGNLDHALEKLKEQDPG